MNINKSNFNIIPEVRSANNADKDCLRLGTKPDSFQKSIYSSSVPTTNKSNVSVNSLYSPLQLLKAYSEPSYVNFLIKTNPDLQNLLAENGLDGKVYSDNITKTSKSHLTKTKDYALQIAGNMNISQAEKQILEQAAIFHDFGKILVPSEILEKTGSLNEEEKKIMDLHSELGYELLSGTGMNKRVLDLVKNHHNSQTQNADILGQILSVADIYSALREERSYKTSMSKEESLKILDQKAQNGEVSTEVVNALKASLSNTSAFAA